MIYSVFKTGFKVGINLGKSFKKVRGKNDDADICKNITQMCKNVGQGDYS